MLKASWTPDKIMAAVLLLGALIMVACGINSEVKFILGTATGYLFGSSVTTIKQKKEEQKENGRKQ